VTAAEPQAVAALYQYLVDEDENVTQQRRCVVNRRLQAFFMKQWPIVGIPKVVDAYLALLKVQKEGDMDTGFTKYVRCSATMVPQECEGYTYIKNEASHLNLEIASTD
jgi:hypothetical protein